MKRFKLKLVRVTSEDSKKVDNRVEEKSFTPTSSLLITAIIFVFAVIINICIFYA